MRARVVLYNPELKAILLIHRLKNERDYWVIPGAVQKTRKRQLKLQLEKSMKN